MSGPIRILLSLTSRLLCMAALLALASCAGTMRDTRRNFNTVVIDAGHGGHDSGARSRRGTLEKDVNLDVANRLEKNLRQAGFRTVMTRRDDRFITLSQRAAISNAQKRAVFVSVHFNWSKRSSAQGIETYYYHPYGKTMAKHIHKSLLDGSVAPNRGVKYARFHVLRNNRNPAVLLELGYLSNRNDDALARDPAYRQKLANLITAGIITMRNM